MNAVKPTIVDNTKSSLSLSFELHFIRCVFQLCVCSGRANNSDCMASPGAWVVGNTHGMRVQIFDGS